MNRKNMKNNRPSFRKLLCVFLTSGLFLLLTSCADIRPSENSVADIHDTWGIEITRLHITANGYMVDFRFRVVDVKKAQELFSRQNKPYLIDQASGKVVTVPNMGKVGPLRNSGTPKDGKIYWMFFDNLSGLIKPGSKVSVVIGSFRVDGLIVT